MEEEVTEKERQLLLRIKQLEETNAELVRERDRARTRYQINAADVYANIRRLQENLFDKLGQPYQYLKVSGFDLKPFFDQARASYGLDSAYARALSLAPPSRRQYFVCLLTFMLLPGSLFISIAWAVYGLFFEKTGLLLACLLVYAIHIFMDDSASRGSRASGNVKRHIFWKTLANYFPVLLLKQNPETVFNPSQTYMFGYHPHGIISVGCFVSFAADATGASEMFPGITIHPATLLTNFKIPFWRELLLRLGVIEVGAKSINHVLKQGAGNAVLIVPGGAAEALDAHPGTHSLTLNKRSGFFRIALQNGSNLVPIYSFGENDLYQQASNEEGSFVRKLQNIFLKYAGFATPFFSGAGSMGAAIPLNPMPARCPIITIVGDPIKCPFIENPTVDDIDAVRVLYVQKLQEIFKQFADKYAPSRSSDLEIVK
jgi:2-acylglycerol O-acyltransferase 2